jgi:2-methylcitrate dehydratase PrpD
MNPYEAAYPGMSRSHGFSTVAETLMSTRFTVATALRHGGVTYDSLRRFDDPVILELVDRIEIVPDEGRAQMTAEAVLRTDGGETTEERIDDPSDLLSWDFDESPAQARALLAETRLSEEALAEFLALVGRVGTLERASDLRTPLTEGDR